MTSRRKLIALLAIVALIVVAVVITPAIRLAIALSQITSAFESSHLPDARPGTFDFKVRGIANGDSEDRVNELLVRQGAKSSGLRALSVTPPWDGYVVTFTWDYSNVLSLPASERLDVYFDSEGRARRIRCDITIPLSEYSGSFDFDLASQSAKNIE